MSHQASCPSFAQAAGGLAYNHHSNATTPIGQKRAGGGCFGYSSALCYTSCVSNTYDRIARYFEVDYAGYDEDLPVIEALAQRTGGPLLDLGCGVGRLLIPLARAGFRVTGVDASAAMTARASAAVEAAGVGHRAALITGDFATADLGGPFRFAFVVMNTFLHLTSQAGQLAALRHWRHHLAPDGLLLLDILHPDVGQLATCDGRLEFDKSWRDAESGATVQKWYARTVDLAEQLMYVELFYDEIAEDGTLRRTLAPFTLRYIWRFEAELLLRAAGFVPEDLYGDWDLAPFDGHSERMIILARARS